MGPTFCENSWAINAGSVSGLVRPAPCFEKAETESERAMKFS